MIFDALIALVGILIGALIAWRMDDLKFGILGWLIYLLLLCLFIERERRREEKNLNKPTA